MVDLQTLKRRLAGQDRSPPSSRSVTRRNRGMDADQAVDPVSGGSGTAAAAGLAADLAADNERQVLLDRHIEELVQALFDLA